MKIDDVVLRGIPPNSPRHREGKLQFLEARRPLRRGQKIVEEAGLHLVAELLKLLGMVQDDTSPTSFPLPLHADSDQNLHRGLPSPARAMRTLRNGKEWASRLSGRVCVSAATNRSWPSRTMQAKQACICS